MNSTAAASRRQKIISLVQKNKLDEAMKQCRKLCSSNAGDPESWFLLGGIHARTGAFGKVIDCCKRVIQLAPEHPGAHYNMAVAYTRTGQNHEALKAYQAALRINPGHAAALAGIAAIYSDQGDYSAAENHYRQAINIDPANHNYKSELTNVLSRSGHFEEALDLAQSWCRSQPQSADAYYSQGVILERLERLDQAAAMYKLALKFQPEHLAANNNLGHVLNELGRPDETLDYFRKVITLSPDSPLGYSNLAVALETLGRLSEAEDNYRQAIEKDPGTIEARNHYGFLLTELGRFDEALEAFGSLLSISPENETAMAGKATTLEHMGKHHDAYMALKPALEKGSTNGDIAKALAIVARHLDKYDEAIDVCKRTLQSPDLPAKGTTDIHFSLGQLYDRCKDWDNAFIHCQAANANAAGDFDIEQHRAYIDTIIDFFDKGRLKELPRANITTDRPIFIVGMPRSGTSLVEQIICSHPDIFGAGELTEISDIENTLRNTYGETIPYPDCIQNLNVDGCNQYSRRYLDLLDSLSDTTRFVTDKMPHNFLSLGLINLLFPESRVIHVQRNPMDTCISLYFQNFNALHAYSNSLASLGQYYREYQRLMEHWSNTLDMNILEVNYEDIVHNQAQATRTLIEFCELPWHEACLDFHTSTRFAKTPSYDQVRQPLYSHSVGRWKHYEHHLSPLKKALGLSE